MTEELAFARKASGLVRGLSTFDAFGLGLLLVEPIYAIWYVIEVGLGLFPGANLLITIGISVLLGGIAGPLVWGILGGTMPRSGGEYIYNSRVISPAIAMGASFCQVVAIIYWNFFLSSMVASPSLMIMGQYMGWSWLTRFSTSNWGIFFCSILCYLVAFLMVAFGMKIYTRIQKPLTVIGFGGPIVMAAILLLCSKATFIHNWNHTAAKYHSLGYHQFVNAVGSAAGKPLPTTWNWGDTIGAMTGGLMLIIYLYTIAYVGGEVKRADKSIIKANALIIFVPVAIAVVTIAALYKMVDFNFLSAAAYNDFHGGVKGYTAPFSTSYMSLTFLASGLNRVVGLMIAIVFLLNSFVLVAIDFILLGRVTFAWGMDRQGPRWFTSISPRWASPVGPFAFFAVIECIGTAAYVWLFPSILTGLVGAGMQIVSVFVVTGIAALLIPFRKKVRGIWESSPYRKWTVFGVPVVSIAAAVYLVYMAINFYNAFLNPKTRDVTGKNVFLFIAVWIIGMCWYYLWKRHAEKVTGIDMSITYGELPPE